MQCEEQRKKKFSLPAYGSQIQAWLFSVHGAEHLAIVHHGRGGNLYNKVFLAQQLINRGMSVLVYDYRGYGESTGVARLKNFVPDGLAVQDFATNKLGYSPAKIVIVGESIGTGAAARSHVSDLAQLFFCNHHLHRFHKKLRIASQFCTYIRIGVFQIPSLKASSM